MAPRREWMDTRSLVHTGHTGNVFGVRFLPFSDMVATGAMDGDVRIHTLENSGGSNGREVSKVLRRGLSVVTYVDVAPDSPHLIWSSSEAGHIHQFDLRLPAGSTGSSGGCILSPQIVNAHKGSARAAVACKSVCVNSTNPHQLLVACEDSYARLYDRRRLPPLDACGTAACENVLLFAPLHLADESLRPSLTRRNGDRPLTARPARTPVGATYAEFDTAGRSILVAYEVNEALQFIIVH